MKDINRNSDSHPVDHKVFVLYEGRGIVAWALAVEDPFNREYDLMFYTRRDKRKLGYGRRLYRKARAWAITRGHKKAYPYAFFPESTNLGFFQKVDPEVVKDMGLYKG
jgi:GNAT superfamily N-acetyltransferase